MHHIALLVILFSVLFQANGIRLSGTDLKNICVQAKKFVASGYSPGDTIEKISSRIERKYQEKFFRSSSGGTFTLSPNDELMLRSAIGAFIGETERQTTEPQNTAAKLTVKDDIKQKNHDIALVSRAGSFDQGQITADEGIFLANAANRFKSSKAEAVYVDTDMSTITEASVGRYVGEIFEKDKEGFPIRHTPSSSSSSSSDESKSEGSSPVIPTAPTSSAASSVTDPAECYAIHYPDQIETEDQTKWATFMENLISQITGRHFTG